MRARRRGETLQVRWAVLAGLGAVAGVVGCEAIAGTGSLTEQAADAGADTGVDAHRPDATTHPDAGSGSGSGSAGPDATVDTGVDTGSGSGSSPTDASTDTSNPVDACTANVSTDRNNCGSCGTVCAATQSCNSGSCVCVPTASGGLCGGTCVMGGGCLETLATGQAAPVGIGVNRGSVYWANTGPDSGVESIPTGGGLTALVATGVCAYDVAFAGGDAGIAWFSDEGAGCAGAGGSVRWENLTGVPTTHTATQAFPSATIAANGSGVYAVEQNGTGWVVLAHSLSAATGAYTTLSTGVDPNAGEITANSTRVFWSGTASATSPILSVSVVDGGATSAPTPVTNPDSGVFQSPGGLAADEDRLYWVNRGSLNLMSAPLDGGAASTLATATGSGSIGADPGYLAIDGSNAYWTAYGGTKLLRVPLGGGTLATIATNLTGAGRVAVDDASVYFVAGTSIMKLTPK